MTKKSEMSRRGFIQSAGAATATLAGVQAATDAAAADGTEHAGTEHDDRPLSLEEALDTFDHVVVLMFENRSFDQILGALYEPGKVPRGQSFEGVLGKTFDQKAPNGSTIGVTRLTDPLAPYTDPGEDFQCMNAQIFGSFVPEKNAIVGATDMVEPYNIAPGAAHTQPPMNGFVRDYYRRVKEVTGREATDEELRDVMGYFAADMLPTFHTLAREFAVFDHWFCDVPSNTYANRSFFHAGQSSGLMNSTFAFLKKNIAETIFERMEKQKVSWKVYWPVKQLASITAIVNYPRLKPYLLDHWYSLEDFHRDAAAGTLPKYSFLEPACLYDRSDMHPNPVMPPDLGDKKFEQSFVTAGDDLLHEVYDSIRRSSNKKGSHAENTLLIVLFDENGGIHDHVPPPAAVPPSAQVGHFGFGFHRAGVRIPALAVSAHIRPNTIVNDPMISTSVIATLRHKWNLGEPLTQRDATAPLLTPVFNLRKPRPASEWPITTKEDVSLQAKAARDARHATAAQDDDAIVGFLGTSALEAMLTIRGDSCPNVPEHMTKRELKAALREATKGPNGKNIFGADR